MVALDQPRGDDPDHALVPALPRDDVAAPRAPGLGPGLDGLDRFPRDPLLDRLPVAVQLLELGGQRRRLGLIFRQEQHQCGLGAAEAAGGVQARSEPEADRAGVDRGRVDPCGPHQLAQAGLLRPRERAKARDGEGAVLVHERDDVRNRRDRDEVEMALELRRAGAQQRLTELPDDTGPAEPAERIVAAVRPDDRAARQLRPGAMVVGHDDLEPELAGVRDLVDRRHAAVHGQDEPHALARQSRQGLAADAVAFVEAARQVPAHVRAELAQDQDCERGRADPVSVVVAVDADLLPGRDRRPDRFAGRRHVAELERIVRGKLRLEEAPRLRGVGVAAADEHARRRSGDAELLREEVNLVARRGAA